MQFVKSSKNKHESDIPDADIESISSEFSTSRLFVTESLRTKCYLNKIEAIAPVYELFQMVTDAKLSQQSEQYLLKLEKQFVVRGDILFEKADCDNANKLFLYATVSYYLLQRFQGSQDLNALNSAIRVNDGIVKLMEQVKVVYGPEFIEELFKLEACILKDLSNGI